MHSSRRKIRVARIIVSVGSEQLVNYPHQRSMKTPYSHLTGHRQEDGVGHDDARTGHELRCHPVPAFTDFRPAVFDAAPEPTLADGIAVGAQRLHEFGIAIGDRSECLAELMQERLQGIGSVLLHYGLLLYP